MTVFFNSGLIFSFFTSHLALILCPYSSIGVILFFLKYLSTPISNLQSVHSLRVALIQGFTAYSNIMVDISVHAHQSKVAVSNSVAQIVSSRMGHFYVDASEKLQSRQSTEN